jgi:AraC-like DNA-binding protein
MHTQLPSNLAGWQQLARASSYRPGLMSKKLGICERQLERISRRLFGDPPRTWLSEQRLMEAPGLLQTHRSVKFVAFELGFRQVSHFSRNFKLYYGLSPKAFLDKGTAWPLERL